MIQLKTTVSVQQEITLELETPAFYKQGSEDSIIEFIGIIDEDIYINIYRFKDNRTVIENAIPERHIQEINNAYAKWEHISEEEFFEALDKALKDFNFKPSLIERKPDRDEAEEERKLLQGNY